MCCIVYNISIVTSFVVCSAPAHGPGPGGGAVSVDAAGRLGAGVEHAVHEGVALDRGVVNNYPDVGD